MPPKKRARISAASTPPLDPPAKPSTEPTAPTAPSPSQPTEDPLNDPWTDDQETSLFKSMIRWKPTGIHKHFHMLAISSSLRSHGYHPPSAPHTRIPGIWAKLRTLYDLDALDEREASHAAALEEDKAGEDDDDDEGGGGGAGEEFSLPDEEYGELMWARRLRREEGSESPEVVPGLQSTRGGLEIPGQNAARMARGSTVGEGEDEGTRAAPGSARARGGARGGRGAGRAGRGAAKGGARGGKVQSSQSVEESSEEEEGSEEADESEEEEEGSTAGRAAAAGRGRGTKRGRAGRRGGRRR